MILDEIDEKILHENFDEEIISQIDMDNISKIFDYLYRNGIYYAKDLFLSFLDLFLLSYDEFVRRFEKFKNKLGADFAELLGDDLSLIEYMYID